MFEVTDHALAERAAAADPPAREAVDVGAEVIVAQGGEAGGHSGNRSTLTLVPEVADFLAHVAPDTLLVAAGGIADGRGSQQL